MFRPFPGPVKHNQSFIPCASFLLLLSLLLTVPVVNGAPKRTPAHHSADSRELQSSKARSETHATAQFAPHQHYQREVDSLTTTNGSPVTATFYRWQPLEPSIEAVEGMIYILDRIQTSVANLDADTSLSTDRVSFPCGSLRIQFTLEHSPSGMKTRMFPVQVPTFKQLMVALLKDLDDHARKGFIGFGIVGSSIGQGLSLLSVLLFISIIGPGGPNAANNLIG